MFDVQKNVHSLKNYSVRNSTETKTRRRPPGVMIIIIKNRSAFRGRFGRTQRGELVERKIINESTREIFGYDAPRIKTDASKPFAGQPFSPTRLPWPGGRMPVERVSDDSTRSGLGGKRDDDDGPSRIAVIAFFLRRVPTTSADGVHPVPRAGD